MFEANKLAWASASAANSATALRVLLAEDTQINAEAMKAMAHRFSVEMDVAENGLDAIQMVEAAQAAGTPYTLLLIDIMMPILDGVETTLRLRELGFGPDVLPIIAVTAATSFDEIRSYRAAGIQAFLAKPVGLKEFKATLEAWGHRTRPRASGQQMEVLRELSEQFSERNRQTLKLIDDALFGTIIGPETIEEIRRLLHQIAGTATTFGNPRLSEVARSYEHALLEPANDQDTLRAVLGNARKDLKKRIDL